MSPKGNAWESRERDGCRGYDGPHLSSRFSVDYASGPPSGKLALEMLNVQRL
jgi:hypothetical protein